MRAALVGGSRPPPPQQLPALMRFACQRPPRRREATHPAARQGLCPVPQAYWTGAQQRRARSGVPAVHSRVAPVVLAWPPCCLATAGSRTRRSATPPARRRHPWQGASARVATSRVGRRRRTMTSSERRAARRHRRSTGTSERGARRPARHHRLLTASSELRARRPACRPRQRMARCATPTSPVCRRAPQVAAPA